MTLPTERDARLAAEEHEIIKVLIVTLGIGAALVFLLGGLGFL